MSEIAATAAQTKEEPERLNYLKTWYNFFCPPASPKAVQVSKRRRRSLGGKGQYWRAEFTVTVTSDSDLVDLFHNGVDGYRAQYLRGEKEGDLANELMLDLLRSKLIAAWTQPAPFGADWMRQSIGEGAKVWVHQGRWVLGWKRRPIRVELAVDDWLTHQADSDEKIRTKVKLGALCPRSFEVDVKGIFLSPEGVPCKPPKPLNERARQIHMYGFT
jgi:hypothetical protein